MFKVLDLFSGIGGFSLGLERTGGFKTVAFCEIDEFPRKVLVKHWPDVPIYHDIRELTGEKLRQDGIVVDVVTGGFPCQDISVAGKQAGIEGERSGLWTELCRIIGDIRPQYAIVENVSNLLSGPPEQRGGWFGKVLGDLAEIGYDAEWHCIPASAVGAPHKRERIWIVAHPRQLRRDPRGAKQPLQGVGEYGQASLADSQGVSHSSSSDDENGFKHKEPKRKLGRSSLCADVPNASGENVERQRFAFRIQQERIAIGGNSWWGAEPNVGRVAHGIPSRVDRLKGLGNAVVPQIVEVIGQGILNAEN